MNLYSTTALTPFLTQEAIEYHARMEELYEEISAHARARRRMTWSDHDWDDWDPAAEEARIRAEVRARMKWERCN